MFLVGGTGALPALCWFQYELNMSAKHLETSDNPELAIHLPFRSSFLVHLFIVVRNVFLAGDTPQDLRLTQIFGTTACRSTDLSRTPGLIKLCRTAK